MHIEFGPAELLGEASDAHGIDPIEQKPQQQQISASRGKYVPWGSADAAIGGEGLSRRSVAAGKPNRTAVRSVTRTSQRAVGDTAAATLSTGQIGPATDPVSEAPAPRLLYLARPAAGCADLIRLLEGWTSWGNQVGLLDGAGQGGPEAELTTDAP